MSSDEDRINALQGISKSSNGLTCKYCGCNQFNTTNTLKKNNQIVRYKACRNCGMTYKTSEKIVE